MTFSISLLLSLQGCFVVSLNHSWSGQSKLQVEDRKNSPYLTASINRKPHIIILPFVFIEWANKKYGVEFAFGAFTTSLNMIDSVQYSIYDGKDSLLIKGTVTDISTKSGYGRFHDAIYEENTSSITDTMSFAKCRTDYIYPIIIKHEPVLKVNAVVFITDDNGNQNKFDFDSIEMVRYGKTIGSFF